jgi:predicted nucleic acid-binding protein
MTASPAFWDASVIVPLCVDQPVSRRVHSMFEQALPVVWWGSVVEVHSAVERLHREHKVNDEDRRGAFRRLHLLRTAWREVVPDQAVRELAAEILAKHPLRAADSLQLAAAMAWRQQRATSRTFISGDERLCSAAELEGFSVLYLFAR